MQRQHNPPIRHRGRPARGAAARRSDSHAFFDLSGCRGYDGSAASQRLSRHILPRQRSTRPPPATRSAATWSVEHSSRRGTSRRAPQTRVCSGSSPPPANRVGALAQGATTQPRISPLSASHPAVVCFGATAGGWSRAAALHPAVAGSARGADAEQRDPVIPVLAPIARRRTRSPSARALRVRRRRHHTCDEC